jgi:hypothetical protein
VTLPENPPVQQPPIPAPPIPAPRIPASGPGPGYASPMPAPPATERFALPPGPIGRLRPTGITVLLFFVTLGIWGFVYYYQVFDELKRHSGRGVGGLFGLLISLFFGVVTPFLLSNEVGELYERTGRPPPVTALTGLWFFPGVLILVGPFIWFARTNRALNDYWGALGAARPGRP